MREPVYGKSRFGPNHFSPAEKDHEFTYISKNADNLSTDSMKAIDNNDLYTVSPDLQDAKKEYRLELEQSYLAAFYTSAGAKAFLNRNSKDEIS